MKKKLNFPIIQGDPMPPPVLTMDQYADFIEFYLQNFFDREAYEKERCQRSPKIPFKLQ